MPAASRPKNANAVTEPPQDPERWRDIQANVRKMDDLYDATFYTWLRSEDNVLVTASYLQRLAGDYDLERIEHALCWLVADWRLESIAILLRQVTFDWAQKGEQVQQESLAQCHVFPNPHLQPAYSQLGQHPIAPPHSPLNTSPVLLQGRRMAVGNEVAAVAAAAAAASVSASAQAMTSPTSASSPTTPTTGTFQHRLPQLLPALTPGSSPSLPSMSPLAATSTVSPISASTLPRPRAALSSHAGGYMTLPRSTRLASQRRPSPAQSSLQAVLQHDTQRHSRTPQPPATERFSVPPSPTSIQIPAGQSNAHRELQPAVAIAPQYTSGFQPTHQRSQTTNGVVSTGSGQHDLGRHSRPQGHGTVGAAYNLAQHPAQDNFSLMYQQQQQQQQQPHQPQLQPTYRAGHIYGSQQRAYAVIEHTPHASPTSVHAMPSPMVTPAGSRLGSPMTSPVSSAGTPYPVAPKPSWSTQQSSMSTNPVFYVNKPLFMECLAKKWSFCKLSEFFQSLDEAAGIGLRLKCTLLKNTALKEEEQLRRASPFPGSNASNNSANIRSDVQSRLQEAVAVPSAQRDQQSLRSVHAEVAASTSSGQFMALSTDDSMMEMDTDQNPGHSTISSQESRPSSDQTSSQSPAHDNHRVSFPAGEMHSQRPASPTIMAEDTIMIEDAPKSEGKRSNTDTVRTTAISSHMSEEDRRSLLESPPSLVPGSPTPLNRGPSSAPPTRARTMNTMDGPCESLHGREYSPMHPNTQIRHTGSSLQFHSTASTAETTTTTSMTSGSGSTPRVPSVSAPIIIVAPEGSTFDDVATTGGDTPSRGSHAGLRQVNDSILASTPQAGGVGRPISIHPLDPYAYSQTSMHPFSHEPDTTSAMTQACAALQAKTESSPEQGWRESSLVNAGNDQYLQHQQPPPQHQHPRGHSQHSRAQTSDAVLSNTLARAALASNALSTLSLSDSKSGTMDDVSVSVAGSTTSASSSFTTMSPMITTAATLGVAAGRRFLNREPPSMSRSLCIESSSGRGRRGGGEDESGSGGSGGSSHSSLFGTGRSMRRHHGAGLDVTANTEDGSGTSSRVTTPSKRKNSLGVTTLQQQQSTYDGSSSSSSTSVSVSRCSNLFSTFSLTSSTAPSPGSNDTLATGFGTSPSPSSSPSPTSSSSSPTRACHAGSLQGHDGRCSGSISNGGSGGASITHFFLTSHSTTQSLPGTRRTSTCTSTTDEDLKRVRCSRPGSVSDLDSDSTLLHASSSSMTMTPSSSASASSSSSSSPTHNHPTHPSNGLSLSSTTAQY
ncbi:hypothetical protein BGZ73_005687 [Actinomortierella ambigua]|nr:hypothetical protein BGZ73_005687 [Actinomortierella ambigua]